MIINNNYEHFLPPKNNPHFLSLSPPPAPPPCAQFCGNVMEELSDCKAGELALKVRQVERHDQPFPSTSSVNQGADVHSELQCRCPWPHRWTLAETRIPAPSETIFMYTCDEASSPRRPR